MSHMYKSSSAIKLGIYILLLSFAFLFLYNLSSGISQLPETTPPLKNISSTDYDTQTLKNITSTTNDTSLPIFDSSNSQVYEDEIAPDTEITAECNLFVGEWVPSELGPIYTKDCNFIDGDQNCLLNGRSDTGYLYWMWKPQGCELPRFDPGRFLESMHDKVLGMIGDSISRNHAQSLICMLSTVEEAVLVYHDESWKNKMWRFPSYNFTVSSIWSPLLAKAEIFEDRNGVSSSEIELHLDVLDSSWTEQYINFDYVLFATGAWFTKGVIYYENNTILGCYRCSMQNITQYDYYSAHRKVIKQVYDNIIASNHKGTIIYRTMSPSHFEYGNWTSGGTCNRTVPDNAGEVQSNDIDKNFHNTELEEFNSALVKASESGVNLKILDVSNLALRRPDGHVGQTRHFPKPSDSGMPISDCLHWCVPGPIDYWNDLLMEILHAYE